MLTHSHKLYLLFFFCTILSLLVGYTWIIFLFLKILLVFIVFCVIIWCIFQTLDILNAFNIKWEMNKKKEEKPNAVEMEQEVLRGATYPAIPSGWYPLCYSSEVKKGQVIEKKVLGKHYAIFRGESNGEIGILNAFCPHLGASLVVGGEVCDDELQCIFHRWRFDKNGKCTDIPYLPQNAKIPNNANTKSYPSIEYHDMICVYYDSNDNDDNKDNKIQSVPLYNLPIQQELLDKSKYSYIGSVDHGSVKMHIREFAENAVDWAHFAYIHGKMMFPFTQIEIPLINRWLSIHHEPATHIGGGNNRDSITINANKYGPDNKYFLYFINKSQLKWNGNLIANSSGHSQITFCGPAGICIFKFSIPAYDPNAKIYLFHTHLPENKMNLRVRFHWYASNKLPRLLVWYVVGQWLSQWTNDIAIWENKIFLNKPCLVRGDGPINKMRRWWKQFYPKQEDNDKLKKDKVVINNIDNQNEEKEKEQDIVNNNNNQIDW